MKLGRDVQPVAGQGSVVVTSARGVEPPVFGDAEGGVVVPLLGVIPPSRGGRCHFQHEVRWFALVSDGEAHLPDRQCPVHAEGNEQVRMRCPSVCPGVHRTGISLSTMVLSLFPNCSWRDAW